MTVLKLHVTSPFPYRNARIPLVQLPHDIWVCGQYGTRPAANSADHRKEKHPHPVHTLLVTSREIPEDNPHHERRRQQ